MAKSVIHAKLGSYQAQVDTMLADMAKRRLTSRLWSKDYRLWKPQPTEIDNRLGWLTVSEKMQERVGSLKTFAESVRDDGFRHVVLLGMGGSSLGPKVLHRTFSSARGLPKLIVLDSTVPGVVPEVTRAIRPARTLFILASKSGGTIEVMSLFAHFWKTVTQAKGNTGGHQFLAITDPGTSLATLAHERGFRSISLDVCQSGGYRRPLLCDVLFRTCACRAHGTGSRSPDSQEPMAPPTAYDHDRLFIYLRLDDDANERADRHAIALERAGHPVVRLTLRDRYDLGGEFFRWEFATAVAGHYLGIHPFDQPNVQESKENTARILVEVRTTGRLPSGETDRTIHDVLDNAQSGSYVALLAYVRPSSQMDTALRAFRKSVMMRYRFATTARYGPRYLHSTGQLHKGGPPKGEFIGDMVPDVTVPNASYTFGTLAQAQAVGDLQSLEAHDRPVIRIQLTRRVASDLKALMMHNSGKERVKQRSGINRRKE